MLAPWRDTGELQYACDCLGSMRELHCAICGEIRLVGDYSSRCHQPPRWLWPLGDAYHALWTGFELGLGDKLAQGYRFAWLLLLEYDTGLRRPVPVPLAAPEDASQLVRDTASLAALMFGLHRDEGLTNPIPFSVTLVADRLRVPRPRAGEAIAALRQAGALVVEGSIAGRGRPTPLYRPAITTA